MRTAPGQTERTKHWGLGGDKDGGPKLPDITLAQHAAAALATTTTSSPPGSLAQPRDAAIPPVTDLNPTVSTGPTALYAAHSTVGDLGEGFLR